METVKVPAYIAAAQTLAKKKEMAVSEIMADIGKLSVLKVKLQKLSTTKGFTAVEEAVKISARMETIIDNIIDQENIIRRAEDLLISILESQSVNVDFIVPEKTNSLGDRTPSSNVFVPCDNIDVSDSSCSSSFFSCIKPPSLVFRALLTSGSTGVLFLILN
jgi:hypothetical protein